MHPYQYPDSPHIRKHGPDGYRQYESYRDWLRDEFSFRCVYCLHREKWGRRRGSWHIEHWQPQTTYGDKTLNYDNLLYSCNTCNLAKGKRMVPNPCDCMLHGAVEVHEDGTMQPKTDEAKRIIRILGLDSPEDVEFRRLLIGIWQLKDNDEEIFLAWMSYPDDLPDLTTKFCPKNTRPEGLSNTFFAQRKRGALDKYY